MSSFTPTTSPFLLKGGAGYGGGSKPNMLAKSGIVMKAGGGGTSSWMNARGTTPSELQAAVSAQKLADLVGEMATLQVKRVLENALSTNDAWKGQSPKTSDEPQKKRPIKSGPLNFTKGGIRKNKKSGHRHWGRDGLDKDQLDKELEEYAAERARNRGKCLDKELDLYNAQAAAAKEVSEARIIRFKMPVNGGGVIQNKQENVDVKMENDGD